MLQPSAARMKAVQRLWSTRGPCARYFRPSATTIPVRKQSLASIGTSASGTAVTAGPADAPAPREEEVLPGAFR